jgi:K+-sensing histidine kinase KdpD
MTRPSSSKADPPSPSVPPLERLRPYLWAVLAISAGLTLRALLTPVLGSTLPFITLFPAVFVAAYVGGFGPTLLATFVGVLAALYLFIGSPMTLSGIDPAGRIGVALFVVSGLMTGWLGVSRLRYYRRATWRAGHWEKGRRCTFSSAPRPAGSRPIPVSWRKCF